jgi:hypothetical protein
MLEECVDYLELATKSLNLKIQMLEEEESSLLFSNTDTNSVEGELFQNNPSQNTNKNNTTH